LDKTIKILHIDSNHPLLMEQLQQAGFTNHEDFTSSKEEIEAKIHNYKGIVIRSRFKIDKTFLDKATNLQFIARVGAGLESIDCEYAISKKIQLIAAPEGNRIWPLEPGKKPRSRTRWQNRGHHWLWQYGKIICQKIARF
jgi:D-3-phosphoglycerate dehydrogenase